MPRTSSSQRPSGRGASINPSPGGIEFARQREIGKDIVAPFRQVITAKAEDRLHRVAEHAGWQCLRRVSHHGVLPDGAILVSSTISRA